MPQKSLIRTLTPRELEVLTLIADGFSLAEIAHKLCRSLKTIESHRLSIGRKLKASNRVELARIAIAEGLVSLDAGELPGTEAQAIDQDPAKVLQWLGEINAAVCNVSGRRYIEALCNSLSHVLGVRFAAVCLAEAGSTGQKRCTAALSDRGQIQPTLHYEKTCSLSAVALENGICRVNDGVAERYPQIEFATANHLRSYLGIRLSEEGSDVEGVLAVMDDKPIENLAAVEQIMRFFLARTSLELDLLHHEKELQDLRRQLSEQGADARATDPLPHRIVGFINLNQLLTHRTGLRLLSDLAEAMCDMFEARYCGICVKDTLKGVPVHLTLAFNEKGCRLDPIEYPVVNTPCEHAVKDGFFAAAHGVADAFPQDQWLSQYGIHSYFGIRLESSDHQYIGVMWLVDDRPRLDARRIEDTLRYLAPRVGAEVQMLMELERQRQFTEKLEEQISNQQAAAQPHKKRASLH